MTNTTNKHRPISQAELMSERELRARAVIADYRQAIRLARAQGRVSPTRVMAAIAARYGLTEGGVRYILTSRGEYTPLSAQTLTPNTHGHDE